VHREILRSIGAIASGWIAATGGYILTVVVFSLFNPDTFTPGVPLPTGWLLVTLSLSAVWSVAAGFVVGVVARRREVEHVFVLILLALIVSVYFVIANGNLGQVPTWYIVAGEALTSFMLLLGGCLRRNQRILVGNVLAGMVPVADDARQSLAIAVDRWRFLIAVVVILVTFQACFWALALGAGEGVFW